MMGGSSKAPKQPTQTTQTVVNIPPELMPYATRLMGQTQALTDINQNPFVSYGGQQVAGFSPLQQQAFSGLQSAAPAWQLGQASGLAGMAATTAAQRGGSYQALAPTNFYGQAMPIGYGTAGIRDFTGPAVQQYMTPYMEQVVNQQKLGAVRDYARELPGLASLATQAGGIGGTRQALMQAEAQRNLYDRMAGIEAAGTQSAYEAAQAQFNAQQQASLQAQLANQQAQLQAQQQALGQRGTMAQYGLAGAQLGEESRQFGANLGLQYLQQQLAAAGMLGELGQAQQGQMMDIYQQQLAAGETMRSAEQQQLTALMEQFAAEQNYPYQQLAFMSDIIRGVPVSGGASATYQAPASVLGQVAGLGVGLGSLFGGTGARTGTTG